MTSSDQTSPPLLHDLLGNVWEWTLDEYHAEAYTSDIILDRFVHCIDENCSDQADHVARGGGAGDGLSAVRPSNRAFQYLRGRTGIRVLFSSQP